MTTDQLPLATDHVELLRQRLIENPKEPVVFKNRSVVKRTPRSEIGITVLWHGLVERHYSLRSLEKAMDYALNGSGRPPGPHHRRFPGRPFNYRPAEELARELKIHHKEGRFLDIPIPDCTGAPVQDEGPVRVDPDTVVLPDDQPF